MIAAACGYAGRKFGAAAHGTESGLQAHPRFVLSFQRFVAALTRVLRLEASCITARTPPASARFPCAIGDWLFGLRPDIHARRDVATSSHLHGQQCQYCLASRESLVRLLMLSDSQFTLACDSLDGTLPYQLRDCRPICGLSAMVRGDRCFKLWY